jgi:hypothetical protein
MSCGYVCKRVQMQRNAGEDAKWIYQEKIIGKKEKGGLRKRSGCGETRD